MLPLMLGVVCNAWRGAKGAVHGWGGTIDVRNGSDLVTVCVSESCVCMCGGVFAKVDI